MRFNSIRSLAVLCAIGGAACGPGTGPDEGRAPRALEELVISDVAPPAIQGGTLTISARGNIAAASDPDRDRIWLVDLDASSVLRQLELAPGSEPGRIAALPDGSFRVVLRGTGEIATVHADRTLGERRAVCESPQGLAHDDPWLHVACANGELVSWNLADGTERRRYYDRDLRDVVVLGSQLLVSRFRSAEVLRIDRATHLDPEATVSPMHRMRPGMTDGVTTPAVAWRMIPDATGQRALMVHQRGSTENKEVVISDNGGYGGGPDPCSPSIVQAAVSEFTVDGVVSSGAGVSGLVLPVDLAIQPAGTVSPTGSVTPEDTLTIAAAGNLNDPSSFVPAAASGSRSTFMFGGFFPGEGGVPVPRGDFEGDARFAPTGGFGCPPSAGIRFQDGRQVVAVAYDHDGRLIAQTRDPWAIVIDGGVAVSLPGRDRKDSGHDLFHEDTGGGLACASCHPGGGDDGQVWTFEMLGQRRTQNISGGILGTEPFHWTGDMHDFGTLSHEVFSERMGGPDLPSAHTGALATWIDTMPAQTAGHVADPAAVERGRAIYNRADTACASCHGGERLSNNTTVDVGTGLLLQVPSLVGVSLRAPFMHTGCATTLEERFTNPACGGGDSHGQTSHLSPSEIDDLVAYLGTL
jgi:mono/diheme cytochrome c family protein